MVEKEIKEITHKKDRYCSIITQNCNICVSNPYEKDTMKEICERAERLAVKFNKEKKLNYIL